MRLPSPTVVSIALMLANGQEVKVGQQIVTHIPKGYEGVKRKEVTATQEMIEEARRRSSSLKND